MRIGFNPQKDKQLQLSDFFHQIIIPVYIPNQEGYFKDVFTIFKYCIQSLFKTCHEKTFFTVVNNGSCDEVEVYLDNLYKENQIHELIHTNNIGKLNAVLKGITGQNFSLITITDADVLFLNDWQKETYKIFDVFPKTGAVCPTPSSKVLKQYTSNVLLENFFSKKLKFTKTINRKALLDFAHSIGNSSFYNENHLSFNLTISKNEVKALIGAGHFVTTYRGDVFKELRDRFSIYGLGGDSEWKLLDKPVLEQGFWRLSTEDNFAYHMGNTLEPWMLTILENIKSSNSCEIPVPKQIKLKNNKFVFWFQQFLFNNILVRKPIWKRFLRYKGLSKEAAENY